MILRDSFRKEEAFCPYLRLLDIAAREEAHFAVRLSNTFPPAAAVPCLNRNDIADDQVQRVCVVRIGHVILDHNRASDLGHLVTVDFGLYKFKDFFRFGLV